MVLDPKHFDDMDDFSDFDEKLECAEGDFAEAGPNHPLAWRRLIIERAVNNVKKALEIKADINSSYKKGDLVYDGEAHKFGRVIESTPGFLNISLLAGGKLVRQDVNPVDFIRQNRTNMTLPEMAQKLMVSEIEVMALLNKLELEPDKKPSQHVVNLKKAGKPLVKKTSAIKPAQANIKAKLTPKKAAADKLKKAASTKVVAKGKPPKKLKKESSTSFTRLLPKGAMTDPVRDPNGYIQQNFLLMSNRELSFATGLSEHTIRRKLGEWNLKRKDFVNKA